MVRAKLVAAFLLVLAGLIVVLQNTQPVETKFLFLSVTMPIAALLALAMLIGIAVGNNCRTRHIRQKTQKTRKPSPPRTLTASGGDKDKAIMSQRS